MKIMRLDLLACGPFTDLSLDLGRGGEGLHLIYGPNEAGKSSTLRALGYLLFGIPDRCEDAFKHTYNNLRIGGALRMGNGAIIEAVRRKGRANTLRGPDDCLLDEDRWREACGRISAVDFSRRFGIDHDTLIEGGSEIIKGEGELAEILFAAGAGLASFRKIEEQVRDEALELFKPGGSKPKINAGLSSLGEEQKKLRELQLPNEKWEAHFKAHQAAVEQRRAVETELERAEQEKNRLTRLRTALPLAARRKSLRLELCGYTSTVSLPEGFSEKRQKTVQSLRLEEQIAHGARQRLETLRSELGGLKSSPALLSFSKEIDELYPKLGSYRKALSERPKLIIQRKAFEDQARELLAELRGDFPFESIEELRLRADQEILIKHLGTKREKYTANLENALEKTRELSDEIAEMNQRLSATPLPEDLSRLRAALEEPKSCPGIEEDLSRIGATLLNAEEQANLDLAGLELWSGSLDELERLRIPDTDTMEDFEGKFRHVADQIAYRMKEAEKLSGEIRKLQTRVTALRADEAPSVADLDLARSVRTTGWKVIRRALEGGEVCGEEKIAFIEQLSGVDTLPDAFEKSVLIADELSDRLRREAGRVAELNNLVSTADSLKVEKDEIMDGNELLEKQLENIQREWAGLWTSCGFAPAPPDKMRKWAAKRSELVRKKMEIRTLWRDAEQRSNRLEELKGALGQCLSESGHTLGHDESLREMLGSAEILLAEQTRIATERGLLANSLKQKNQELGKAEARAAKARRELEEWRNEWAEAISPLGLGEKSIPEQANAVLGKLQEIFAKLKESKNLGQRVEEIDAECEVFVKQTAELVDLIAPESCGANPEEAVRGLNELMATARDEKNKRDDLTMKILREEGELADARNNTARLHIEISEILKEAACKEIEDLAEAESRSATKKELLGKLEQVEEQLVELSAGLSIEEFSTEVEGLDPDLIEPLLGQAGERIAQLKEGKSELDQTIGSERTALGLWDGRGDAAELAQRIQARLADLENKARHYSRLKIAHVLLLRAKERHREKSQGPVLKRTSELFSALTLGAFESIRAGDDEGKNVIVGLRPGGQIVPVRAMSEGTADQLYLALRLASFEHYIASHEPLPLVLDDILVQFDNDRSRAALRVLAEVSGKAQIIMFSHHAHLVELARAEIGMDRLFVSELR